MAKKSKAKKGKNQQKLDQRRLEAARQRLELRRLEAREAGFNLNKAYAVHDKAQYRLIDAEYKLYNLENKQESKKK